MGDVEDWEPKPKKEHKEPKKEVVELDPYTEHTVVDFANTNCQHFYCEDDKQDPNTELTSVRCINCPHGVMINYKLFKIDNGKIVKR